MHSTNYECSFGSYVYNQGKWLLRACESIYSADYAVNESQLIKQAKQKTHLAACCVHAHSIRCNSNRRKSLQTCVYMTSAEGL